MVTVRRVGWLTWSSFWFEKLCISTQLMSWGERFQAHLLKACVALGTSPHWCFLFSKWTRLKQMTLSVACYHKLCVCVWKKRRDTVGQSQLFNTCSTPCVKDLFVSFSETPTLFWTLVANTSRVQSLPQRKTLYGSHMWCELGEGNSSSWLSGD